MAHVFERSYRGASVSSQTVGNGIGLTSSRQIVEPLDGTIGVQTEEGKGSTFTVRLPTEPL